MLQVLASLHELQQAGIVLEPKLNGQWTGGAPVLLYPALSLLPMLTAPLRRRRMAFRANCGAFCLSRDSGRTEPSRADGAVKAEAKELNRWLYHLLRW